MNELNSKKYEQLRAAIDPVIFTIKNQKLLVYLNTREKEPHKNLAELPGGLLLVDETAEETLRRKLKDIIGDNVFFQQFYTFTEPKRDVRYRTISIGFIALVSQDKITDLKKFQSVDNLPKLAFDHQEIIEKATGYLKQNLSGELIKQFMPKYFPLNDLQVVYEVIEQKKLDNRNFRKKILGSEMVKKIKRCKKTLPTVRRLSTSTPQILSSI